MAIGTENGKIYLLKISELEIIKTLSLGTSGTVSDILKVTNKEEKDVIPEYAFLTYKGLYFGTIDP